MGELCVLWMDELRFATRNETMVEAIVSWYIENRITGWCRISLFPCVGFTIAIPRLTWDRELFVSLGRLSALWVQRKRASWSVR